MRLSLASKQVVARFDFIGQAAAENLRFIRHVGLCISPVEVSSGDSVAVAHMGPPLELDNQITAHVVGSASLSWDETMAIGVFLDKHDVEHRARGLAGRVGSLRAYIVRPHAQDAKAPDGTTIYRRFNCAGLAVDAYHDAGIDFIVTDEGHLPLISRDTLGLAYSELNQPEWQAIAQRFNWGLEGDGPWPVLLSGYLLHALNRDVETLRTGQYVPQRGDEMFD